MYEYTKNTYLHTHTAVREKEQQMGEVTTDLIALSLADSERVWDYQASDIDWQAVSNIACTYIQVCHPCCHSMKLHSIVAAECFDFTTPPILIARTTHIFTTHYCTLHTNMQCR